MGYNGSLFRLSTTLTGINVVDTWKLASFHNLMPSDISVVKFAGVLSYQLIALANKGAAVPTRFLPSTVVVDPFSSNTNSTSLTEENRQVLQVYVDCNSNTHSMVMHPIGVSKNGAKKRRMSRPCFSCSSKNEKHLVGYRCLECNKTFCHIDKFNAARDCFVDHVKAIVKVYPTRASGGE